MCIEKAECIENHKLFLLSLKGFTTEFAPIATKKRTGACIGYLSSLLRQTSKYYIILTPKRVERGMEVPQNET